MIAITQPDRRPEIVTDRKPSPILIPDGYTRHVGFDECSNFPEFTFVYRPMRGLEKSDGGREIWGEQDKEKRHAAWFGMLERHVLSWNVSDDFARDIKQASPIVLALITDVIDGTRRPDFEIDGEGNRIDFETDEELAGNSTPG